MKKLLVVAGFALVLAIAACSDNASTDDSADTTSTRVTSGSSSSSSSTPTSTLTPFPPARTTLSHGGLTWAVVLAGAPSSEDPALTAAVQVAKGAGYTTGPTDCDVGAAALLGMPEDGTSTVSVYLSSQADAQQALRAFHERGFDGGAAGQIETYCMD